MKRLVGTIVLLVSLGIPTPAHAVVPSAPYSFWHMPSQLSQLREHVVPSMQAGGQWFFATQFGTHDNGYGNGGGYIGLLNNVDGKQAIFSFWGATFATAPTGCRAEPFNEGGPGYHATCPYNWVNGRTYEYVVTHGTVFPWWDGWICDVTTSIQYCSKIGSIQVPTNWGYTLDMYNNGSVPNFTEWVGGDLGACRNYPQADVYFGRPYGDLYGTRVTASFSGFGGGTTCSPQLWYDGASAEHTVPGNVVYG